MKKGKFIEGTLIKGKDLKGYILCKILTEDMVMRGFQYKMGLNEDVNPLATTGSCEAGLHFCLIKDVYWYLYYGSRLALISIPDDEDVYVDIGKFHTHKIDIKEIMHLGEAETWMYLCKNGVDITANNNNAIVWAASYGYLEVVKYLHKNGADITAQDNDATVCAAEHGYLEVIKYLHENGADITAQDNCAVRWAAESGYLEVVKYLHENGADITADDNYAVRCASEEGHTDVVEYLQANM